MFEHKQAVIRADALDFRLQRGGDITRCFIGNNRDPFFSR